MERSPERSRDSRLPRADRGRREKQGEGMAGAKEPISRSALLYRVLLGVYFGGAFAHRGAGSAVRTSDPSLLASRSTAGRAVRSWAPQVEARTARNRSALGSRERVAGSGQHRPPLLQDPAGWARGRDGAGVARGPFHRPLPAGGVASTPGEWPPHPRDSEGAGRKTQPRLRQSLIRFKYSF